ncbi:MAG: four helix bundle protein [Planctomycetes bacterium]|nr:four helix bundle protein [Planctomycetota bacterium]
MSGFDHEKLDVSRIAIAFLVIANDVVEAVARGRGYLADQLQRASTSVVLNIAEGAGEYSAKDKARFYRMAKRSATECAAILDVCQRLDLIAEERYRVGREHLFRTVSMLVRLVRSVGESRSDPRRG